MTVYYVDPVSGNNGNTGLSHDAQPWATFQHALDNVTAGNEIRLMNTGTESLTGTNIIQVDTNASSLTSQIAVYGADSNGDRLNGTGVYTIDGSGMDASQDILQFRTITTYMQIHDVRFTAAPRRGVYYISGTPYVTLHRCIVDSCADCNIGSNTANGVQASIDCEVYGSTGSNGYQGFGSGLGNLHVYGGSSHDNNQSGYLARGDFSGFQILRGGRYYDNAQYGIWNGNAGTPYAVNINNTCQGNGNSGIRADSVHLWMFSNSLSDSIYGFQMGGGTTPPVAADYNHYYNNSGGEWSNGSSPELNKQTGDPLFTSTTDGSEDFTPLMGSPLLDNSLATNRDIGAIERPMDGGSSWWQP